MEHIARENVPGAKQVPRGSLPSRPQAETRSAVTQLGANAAPPSAVGGRCVYVLRHYASPGPPGSLSAQAMTKTWNVGPGCCSPMQGPTFQSLRYARWPTWLEPSAIEPAPPSQPAGPPIETQPAGLSPTPQPIGLQPVSKPIALPPDSAPSTLPPAPVPASL